MRARDFIQLALLALAASMVAVPPVHAVDATDPAADAKAFRDYFVSKFPKVKLEDFVNGPYFDE